VEFSPLGDFTCSGSLWLTILDGKRSLLVRESCLLAGGDSDGAGGRGCQPS